MNTLLSVLMGSAMALSVVTLFLLFTGNLWAMTATGGTALLLAVFAIPTLDRQEAEHASPLDG
ncbi:hypothetical protein [Deinococcus sp. QL22]|uniref:hypothetical protein n=1 Tax=Deinococcus sp. QL22 TaxID=2939437 RepID=UPI0020182BFA|nr:hypothetical protein [Deinococcus sp. QL22]UQN10617.1 hypothetical protein M1R55_30955 [Deinococcus sp. QL22]